MHIAKRTVVETERSISGKALKQECCKGPTRAGAK